MEDQLDGDDADPEDNADHGLNHQRDARELRHDRGHEVDHNDHHDIRPDARAESLGQIGPGRRPDDDGEQGSVETRQEQGRNRTTSLN